MFACGSKSLKPKLPAILMGFGNVLAEKLDDPLEVNVIITKDEKKTFIFISMDVLFIGDKLRKEVISALKIQKTVHLSHLKISFCRFYSKLQF